MAPPTVVLGRQRALSGERNVKTTIRLLRGFAIGAAGAASAGIAFAQAPATPPNSLLGTDCNAPPSYHCPPTACDTAVITQPGNNVELKTRRTFFLDCPTGYKKGDKVTVLLSLHGFGSYANWQRNYAPFYDLKDKYKLVVITPGSPVRFWGEADDEYLHNIVDQVVDAVGKANVDRFILAGHSQGGLTSSRLVCTDYFKDKVDVRISLSGGRVGPSTSAGKGFANAGPPVYQQVPGQAPTPPQNAANPTGAAAPSGPPGGACDYSFIFENGANETIPGAESPLATKFGCQARRKEDDVVDPKAGYVWDASRQDPGSDGWGRYPRSGRAEVYTYPNCKDGRVVADVVRLQKGHTEGLEPNVTDKLIQLATSAKGGKIRNGSWNPPPPPPSAGSPFGPPPAAAPARN
jgi:pimeloyl-ACP methyl ester carboxylesterase